MIDTNMHLGEWPFRRFPQATTAERVARLKSLGVTQAWAGTFEGVFHRDLSGANARLAEACAQAGDGFLLPFGSINPRLPDWREDLRRASEVHKLAGIRLYPGYHGYTLDLPEFSELLTKATAARLPVQVAVKLEDERTQAPLMPVAGVDLLPLVGVAMKVPGLRLQVLNGSALLAENVVVPLSRAATVLFDFAMVEGAGGVGKFADRVGLERVAFGTHFPFFYAESSVLKLRESDFSEADLKALRTGNADRWRTAAD